MGDFAKMVAAVLEDNWQNIRDEVDPETDRPLGGTRMLKFACGTGLISGKLVLFIAEVVNVDISQDIIRYGGHLQREGTGERLRR